MNSLISVPEGSTKLDVLALRYRAASAKTKAGREQWIEGTLELATVIWDGRIDLPDHVAFGQWVKQHDLKYLSPNDRIALIGIAEMHRKGEALQLLEQYSGYSWRNIWEKKVKKPKRAPITNDKGAIQTRRGKLSGSASRKRANRIPTVMQEDNPEPAPKRTRFPPKPERKFATIKALSREQVDPDFKGTDLEFSTKYGHVTLQTKDEIENNKHQETLMAWIGAVTEHERTGRAVMTAFAAVDLGTLCAWQTKPGKAEKLKAWRNSIELACESVLRAPVTGGCNA